MRLMQCHNFHDFRELARGRLPGALALRVEESL